MMKISGQWSVGIGQSSGIEDESQELLESATDLLEASQFASK
jgi:hypothetical protein